MYKIDFIFYLTKWIMCFFSCISHGANGHCHSPKCGSSYFMTLIFTCATKLYWFYGFNSSLIDSIQSITRSVLVQTCGIICRNYCNVLWTSLLYFPWYLISFRHFYNSKFPNNQILMMPFGLDWIFQWSSALYWIVNLFLITLYTRKENSLPSMIFNILDQYVIPTKS